MTQLAELSLWIAVLMAAWSATLSAQGAVMRRASFAESGRRGLTVAMLFTLIAGTGLGAAFLRDEYSVRYVAMHSGENVDLLYKLAAAWSDRAGELLLAAALFAFAATMSAKRILRVDADRLRAGWTVAVFAALLGAALAIVAFKLDPFAPLPRNPGDGRGLDPVFRNDAMIFQPPLMLLGAACAAVTTAMAAVAFARRSVDGGLTARLRASATEAWGLLMAALLIGAHWAYASPGVRATMMKDPAVLASAAALAALTLYLVVVELRASRNPPRAGGEATRRKSGLILVALGAALCAAMFAARPFARNYDAQIADGESYHAKDAWGHAWTFTSQGASRLERPGDDVTAVALLPARDGARQPFIASESRQYYTEGGLDVFPAQTVPGIHSGITQDLVVVLSDAGEGRAVLRISFFPLVELAWIGGVFFALGGVLLFWPRIGEGAA